ncbi:hypothetical protein [Streptomyces sp. NPDC014685]|uniref:hypothetical protein n=1 Tax=Streptomyces sp. NPDC014685 TaxID=3364881 RepID=UPI0036F63E8B
MRIHRVLAGLGVSAVLGLGILATPAQAAEPAQASAQGMVFYDDFWTKAECEKVGRQGQAQGMWRLYTCQESLWDWDLYIAR